jgi:multiple sugar transport system permease protein
MRTNPVKKTIGRIILYFLVALFLIWTIFPFYWLFTMSFKSPIDAISNPPKFTFKVFLENYKAALNMYVKPGSLGFVVVQVEFLKGFKNSMIIGFGSVAVALAVGVPAAYALARTRSRLQKTVGLMFLFVRFIPTFAVVIPLFILWRQLKLYDTYHGMILAYQMNLLPYLIWMMKGYFADIPIEIEEAAKVDGCTAWQVFRNVALPLVAPGLAASAVLVFVAAWNTFEIGYILSQTRAQPVTVALTGYSSTYTGQIQGLAAAAGTLVMLPELLVAGYVQKYIVRGLTLGHGK